MSEALARTRNDSILARPAKSTGGRGIVRRLVDRARVLPARVYAGAAFSALLAGIGINALLLQRERHPAPLFGPTWRRASPAPSKPLPVRPQAAAGAAPAASPQAPSPAPARSATAGETASGSDQIGEFLRGGSIDGDQSRVIQAAQSSLARLGYQIKADGVEGAATGSALRDFERAHGLPVTTELTPHLLKQLTAAARTVGR
ncbi:MAG TPA: peptidoglycan-binding domain-containing protein [Roseiarcus sp.]|nr:peptidoglycan-binding domain-containing protein [Roseiarcus sp.]